MKVKFQADNDLDRAIVRGVLRRRPVVAFEARPINAINDYAVLDMAAAAGRILVSHDVSTMPAAFAEYRVNAHHPGVLLVPQLWPLATAIDHLVLI